MTYKERRVATATADLETARNLVEVAGNTIDSERGRPVAALCRAALKIVNEAYRAAAKLEYEMIEPPYKKEEDAKD